MVEVTKDKQYWWERNWFIGFFLAVSILPLLWPTFPPLNDLTGHMGRYRVQLDLASDPQLQQFYDFEWSLILNLGSDLLMVILGPLFGVEFGTKLILMLTMMLTAGGMLWIAREVHGRIPPTAVLALPFLYGHVTTFGFNNYMLSMGLAFTLFAAWICFDRTGRTTLRPWIMVPASFVLAICHIYGWGVLGLLVFGYEYSKQSRGEGLTISSIFGAAVRCLPLAAPVIMLLFWRSGSVQSSEQGLWFDFYWKYNWMGMALRDRWEILDRLSVIALCFFLIWVMLSKKMHFARQLGAGVVLLLLAFIIIPFSLLSSAYADMRLAPYVFMVALVSVAWPENMSRQQIGWIAMAAVTFCLVRIGSNTVSYALYDQDIKRELAALEVIPEHARLFTFVETDCKFLWYEERKEHLGGLALVRKRAYSNEQWAAAGAQLIRSKIDAPGYAIDGSQFASKTQCLDHRNTDIDYRLSGLPRDIYDYVWFIDILPNDPKNLTGMTRIWADGNSAVYRIDHGDRRTLPITPAAK